MGILDKKIDQRQKALEKKNGKVPVYSTDGRAHSKLSVIPITLGFIVMALGLFVLAVHIPVMTYKEEPAKNEFVLRPNEAGVKNIADYFKDHPNDDFDMDGLTNSAEQTQGTDARSPDTDGDGITDYVEAHVYNTRPTQYDNKLLSIVKEKLDANESQITSPFKLHDVIMWADNLGSRARGTVVPTIRGYRFCNFVGWARFPEKAYAYKIVDGIHVPLEYRPVEDAWRIDSEDEVVLYAQELETTYLLTAFGERYYVDDGFITKILTYILPKEHSFVTMKKIVVQDSWDLEVNATVTGTTMPQIDRNDMSRFGKNMVQFSDITDVYSAILGGRPVAVSLQSPAYGEVIAVVYGYTEFGDLLIANDKGEQAGVLDIIERSSIIVDTKDEMKVREYVDVVGLGFDTRNGDKIYFFKQ